MQIPLHLRQILQPELIKELGNRSKLVALKAGETLIDFGQTVHFIPLIISGTVKISRMDEEGNELLLYYISPAESCAMTFTCCMEQSRSEVKAVAEEDIEFLAVPVSVMDEWMIKYPSWKNFVMKTIHQRFNELLRAIDQIAFQKLDERLIHYLKEKSKATGSAVISLSHEQIAIELATSRVVISRLLKKLEIDKKVVLYRNQIKLLSGL